ncbi:IS3 family transposase [Kocuria rosea]|uniref:IS3 family transposase n=1 Tax=Kocuria rosea TaxID=1275 RepID=UPI001643D25E|nr:IS3 family transposase [Kocuria rosea]
MRNGTASTSVDKESRKPGAVPEHRRREGGPSSADEADAHEAYQARPAWAEHRRVYGARRLTAELRHRGHRWNRKKVARLMRVAGVEGTHRRHRGSTANAPPRCDVQGGWSVG